MPLADQLTLLLRMITPALIWFWLACSLGGLVYALRLWGRARSDVHNQRGQQVDGVLAHIARGNLRRVQVRVLMFLDFLLVGVCAIALLLLPPGVLREIMRFLYVALLLKMNALVALNSYKDERHDLVLRVLLRREERIASQERPDIP